MMFLLFYLLPIIIIGFIVYCDMEHGQTLKEYVKVNDFEMPAEFSGKSEEELLEEFLNDCPVTEESYISIYGGYYSVMKKLTSAAKNVLVWMTFNSELDR